MMRARGEITSIPAGVPFAAAVAEGLIARHAGDDPLALAKVLLLVPNRRAAQGMRLAFLQATGGKPTLLPEIRPLGDAEEDAQIAGRAGLGLPLEGETALLPAIDPLERQLTLAALVRRWFEAEGTSPAPATLLALAADLARLLDRLQREEAPEDVLEKLVPDDLASHWARTLDFLKIITRFWPAHLKERGSMDPVERRNRLLTEEAELIARGGLNRPVYVAGSTGSLPATARLMQALINHGGGTLILPGLDLALDDEIWADLDESHPQFTLFDLLKTLGTTRSEVTIWPYGNVDNARATRVYALNAAMHPAKFTRAVDCALPLSGLYRIDCAGRREEAGTIALLMREVLEAPGKTAALVTADRVLARAVAHELSRYGLSVDDSAGTPLSDTPPAVFLRLLADAAAARFEPVRLLALLKHPLTRAGRDRADHLAAVAALEIALFRKAHVSNGIPEPGAAKHAEADALLERLSGLAITSLDDLITAAEQLAGADVLWDGDAGNALADHLAALRAALPCFGEVPADALAGFLEASMEGLVVRPRFGRHPRLFIWGTLEARLQHADRMILGGLNDGSWPAETQADPWMSRPMLLSAGLAPPERRIGQSAHDFMQAAAAPEVYLTRAIRVDGTPTVPSRWLTRIEAFIGPLPAGGAHVGWQAALDHVERVTPEKAPEPRPPLSFRPRKLAVTAIERWMQDPYGLYARYILKLKPLDPPGMRVGPRERGVAIHDTLDKCMKQFDGNVPPDAMERLREEGWQRFQSLLQRPAVKLFWWPRFLEAGAGVIERVKDLAPARLPAASEAKGQLVLNTRSGPFTLEATADRIDRMAVSGHLVILDYKTGGIPSAKQVAAGYAPQLPLEGLIAENGGFEGLAGKQTVDGLEFWKLGQTGDKLEPKPVKDAAVEIEKARAGLIALIDAFADEGTPYLSNPRPTIMGRGDYDHLARVDEWLYGGGA